MSLSEKVTRTPPIRVPWATEWLLSWSRHPSAKQQATRGFTWQFARDRQGMSLELSGEARALRNGYASSVSCDVFVAGELYNQEKLCGDLTVPAHCQDAELVLSAWRAWGLDAFGRIDGVFVIIVRDMSDGRLWAVRDPMGCHPLFFTTIDHGLLLSDSVPVLLQHPNVSREVNRLKLAQWSFNYFGELHDTFHNAVYKVPPAHYLCATKESRELKQYWFLPEVRPAEHYSFHDAREDYLRQFAHVVARHHDGGQPSILLSGGLDSISVAIQSADISRRRGEAGPLALSLLFPDPECDERLVQEGVASALGLSQISMSFEETVGKLGLIAGALDFSPRLSAPLLNTWRPAYLPLLDAAKRRGYDVVLTGMGGDEWLGVSPLYMADLLKRGRLFAAARTLREQLRSFNVPLRSALRFQLWTSGLRPLLVQGARPIVTGLAPPVARAIWRRRQRIPAWVAADGGLKAEIRLCLERDIERQFEKHSKGGRYHFYKSEEVASYTHPLVSSDREEDFEIGKLMGQRLAHPYWDARLISSLCEIPPEWLVYDGYSKGLVRGPIAERFPGFGLERKKKVSALRFSIDMMRRELPPAWERLGGPRMLSELGVVDRKIIDAERSDIMVHGDARQLNLLWFMLNMESWVRTHV